MEDLPAELLVIVINCSLLTIKDVIQLLSTCRTMYQLTAYWEINERVLVNENDIFNKHSD